MLNSNEYVAENIGIHIGIYFISKYIYICILILNMCCLLVKSLFQYFSSAVKKIHNSVINLLKTFSKMLTDVPGKQAIKSNLLLHFSFGGVSYIHLE